MLGADARIFLRWTRANTISFNKSGWVALVLSVQHHRSDDEAYLLGQKYYPDDGACRMNVWMQSV